MYRCLSTTSPLDHEPNNDRVFFRDSFRHNESHIKASAIHITHSKGYTFAGGWNPQPTRATNLPSLCQRCLSRVDPPHCRGQKSFTTLLIPLALANSELLRLILSCSTSQLSRFQEFNGIESSNLDTRQIKEANGNPTASL